MDVLKSVISQLVKQVFSTNDCLEKGNTEGYHKNIGSKQNETKQNKEEKEKSFNTKHRTKKVHENISKTGESIFERSLL